MSVLGRIHQYLRATAMPPTLFGRLVANDPRLVGDLRNGRQPGPAMVARIDAFLAVHPAERQRPEPPR